jgi:ssDNA-binding Zn-finger/Zn-ribbon topoisomerase 1
MRKYKRLTASECPDCAADLGVLDDKDRYNILFECPKCKNQFYGHLEGEYDGKDGFAFIIDGRVGTMKGKWIDGETWYQWARRLFEYQNCPECEKGVRGHVPRIVMGHWFALCKNAVKSPKSHPQGLSSQPDITCPDCGEMVWDVAKPDQRLNKCWECGLRFDTVANP